MAISIFNTVQSASLAESPIVVRVDDDSANIQSSSYQFVADLYSWRGDEVTDKPTSPTYTFNKFPIVDSFGGSQLFDFSPYLNSQLSQSLAFEYTYNAAYPRWYSIEMYAKWVENNIEYTSSHENVNGGLPSIATQGYNLWGERNETLAALNEELGGKTAFSQSIENYPILSTIPSGSTLQIYRTDVPFFFATYNRQDAVEGQVSTQPVINNVIAQTIGASPTEVYDPFQFYQSGSFSVLSPMEVKPIDFQSPGIGDGTGFYLRARDSSNVEFGGKINVSYDNCSKYTPVRIAFKNRYGAFDQFDAPLVSRTTFNAQTKQFKTPSLNATLPRYDVFKYNETYFSEGGETITVNTDYVDEAFNEYFKGMLVSDEIYIVEPDNTLVGFQATLKPLVIKSSSTVLKKGEVDKLIQYTFTFQVSTPYKLVL